ncbi:MAG: GAF domain-containing protein [Anaerolinea sp.]|nr:GAF domain-containing protein [Anaerolinea sp.]
MNPFITLLNDIPFLDWPYHLLGWVGLLLMLGGFAVGLWRWWQPINLRHSNQWLLFAAFILLLPLTSLFLAVQLPGEAAIPLPYMLTELSAPVLIFLFALPWVLAAGMLGLVPAVILAFLSGVLLALFRTHTLFTPLEIGLLGLFYAVAVRQPYRTRFYRALRQPFVAAGFVSLLSVPLHMLVVFFSTNGGLAVRLDYALTQVWLQAGARVLELLIAGGVASLVYSLSVRRKEDIWYRPVSLQPSPGESSLEQRLLYGIFIVVVALALVLTVADWAVAGAAARRMIEDRLASAARLSTDSLPYFLETGQSLTLKIAQPDLVQLDEAARIQALSNHLRSVPFFRQLSLFDAQGVSIGGYPVALFEQIRPTEEERVAIQLALKGIPAQTVTVPPWPGENTAQVSFIASIRDDNGQVVGVLLGRTDLNSNPFTQSTIQALQAIADLGGEGVILDENQHILYHTSSSSGALVMSTYIGRLTEQEAFYDDVSATGTRQLVYYRPGSGKPWGVVVSVPAELAQQLALNIAVPLLVILVGVVAIAFVGLRLSLRSVTASLQKLSEQSAEMARGKLETPVAVTGVDEVGRLAAAFEKMRVSLRARLEELNRLLVVSQSVAANLDVTEAVRPVLEAACADQAAAARVVLIRDVTMSLEGNEWVSVGVGDASEEYAYLDGQIFDLTRQKSVVSIPNLARIRRLNVLPGRSQPGAVLAVPIYHENTYYGALWVAYQQARNFDEEEVRFLSTLAGEVALAAANSHLYTTAEIGRQRLEAVLSSTPDPVLVFDKQNCLFLLNPAAVQLPGLIATAVIGRSVEEVIAHADLKNMLMSPLEGGIASREIHLGNGRIYYVSVAPVIQENAEAGGARQFGRICMMRDITHFKELDTLKSDFVATVSHDLRSPLTLMRGYATMLQMVGEMNDQQKAYVQKMILGVDNMSRLVNNLLDLGRIEAGIDLRLELTNVCEVVEQVIGSLMPQATQKNLQLLSEGLSNKVMLQADPALLHQALYNLVENAIKYTPVGGQVWVRLSVDDERVMFEVQDTGIGVAPLDLPRLFEKFYRSGRREAYQQRGTGLGLAIVKSIAERHGGRVWVESQLGKGSSFFMEIPLRRSENATQK